MKYTPIKKSLINAGGNEDGSQYRGDIAGLTGGGFVVVWTQNFGPLYEPGIFARVFNAKGKATGPEQSVHTLEASFLNTTVQALNDGGFVVFYESGLAIGGQRFDADGDKVGTEFRLPGENGEGRDNPSVTLLKNGSLAVLFEGDVINRDGFDQGVAVQIVSKSGQLIGSEVIVDEGELQVKVASDIFALKGGGFGALLFGDGIDGSQDGVGLRLYNGDGTPKTDVIVLESGSFFLRHPSGIQLANGRIVVVWDNAGHIRMQVIKPSGELIGDFDLVSSVTKTRSNEFADVVATPDGGFFVTWSGEDMSSSAHIYGQRYDADYQKVGGKVVINSINSSNNDFVNASVAENGDILVSWEGGPSVDNLDTRVQILEGSFVGTQSDDILTDTVGTNLMFGRDGNDVLSGKGGDDKIYGEDGNDQISGGKGDDRAYGGAGDDRLKGDSGNDLLSGDGGIDRLLGGDGRDDLSGGENNDRLYGENQNDVLNGGTGDDYLNGGKGSDKLNGGKGRDTLLGGAGNDKLTGGAGVDTFVFKSGGGKDRVVDFLSGKDVLKLDDSLWDGTLTKTQVVNQFASVDDGDLVFSFNGGEEVRLDGIGDANLIVSDIVLT